MEGATVSPSSRGRGLKLFCFGSLTLCLCVALFTRAWIEIKGDNFNVGGDVGRPLHEGVD